MAGSKDCVWTYVAFLDPRYNHVTIFMVVPPSQVVIPESGVAELMPEESPVVFPTITMSSSSFLLNLSEWIDSKSQDALISILAAGPIPKHVGFVMDGNRRYARRNQRAVQEGHAEGYVALRRVRQHHS